MTQICICATLPDLAHVPMGGDGLDEKLLATMEMVAPHGGDQWWLYLGKCSACGQDWLVAEDSRIFDEHFLQRLTPTEAAAITTTQTWPETFLSYERVLRIGNTLTEPCRFFDSMAYSLIWTAEDLRKARPEITPVEIGALLGVSAAHAQRLLDTPSPVLGDES